MKAVRFESQNGDLGPPPDDDGRNCGSLPCRHVLIPWTLAHGVQTIARAVMTFWTPSPEELAALNAGRPLGLMVVGGHPPVTLFVDRVGAHAGEITGEAVETRDPSVYPCTASDAAWRRKHAVAGIIEEAVAGAEMSRNKDVSVRDRGRKGRDRDGPS